MDIHTERELRNFALDSEEEGSGKLRKIITIVILLVILFLIAVIVVKFINANNSNDDEQMLAQETASNIILPEELVIPTQDNTFEVFEQVPVASDTITGLDLPEVPVAKVEQAPEPKPQPVITEPVRKKQTTPSTPKVTQPKVSTPKNIASTTLQRGAYIQVASVFSKVDTSNYLIKKLSDAGYSYKTYETIINGRNVVKILVGPFNEDLLAKNIDKIRAEVESSAFVYRIK